MYTTIKNNIYQCEIVIDKSKFIGYAKGVDTVEDANEFVSQISKKHYDATHNCYAYIIDDKAKYSDNGEPQGTAGLPILECIKNKKLNRVAVVVTRYFGGIKLGAGGLVRAYNNSCASVLNIADKVEFRECVIAKLVVPYNLLKVVQNVLNNKVVQKNIVFETDVTMELLILQEQLDAICDIVTNSTNGKCRVEVASSVVCPYEGEVLNEKDCN